MFTIFFLFSINLKISQITITYKKSFPDDFERNEKNRDIAEKKEKNTDNIGLFVNIDLFNPYTSKEIERKPKETKSESAIPILSINDE